MRAAPPVTLAILVAISASACVQETTVIGDDRTRLACGLAPLLDGPPAGCTTITLERRVSYGCDLRDRSGGPSAELAGAWVRLHRDPERPATLRITVVSTGGACPGDAGIVGCAMVAHVTTVGDAPCACVLGALEDHRLALGTTTEIRLVSSDQEVLLEPVGAVFEVSICADASIPSVP